MAAPMVEFLQNNLLMKINEYVSDLLQKNDVIMKEIKFGKRNSVFMMGDIFLAHGCANVPEEVMSKVRNSIMEEYGRQLYFKSVTSDKFNCIVIFLNREIYFKHAITCVHNQTSSYGKFVSGEKEVLVYNHRFRPKSEDRQTETCNSNIQSDLKCITLDTLRSLVLAEHSTLLLQANGYKVTNLVADSCWETVVAICDELSVDTDSFVKITVTQEDVESRLRCIKSHRTVTTQHRKTLPTCDEDKERGDSGPNNCDILELDAKSFISEQREQECRNCFDKNLNTITLAEDSRPSHLLKEAVRLHKCIQGPNHAQIIHITEQSLSFTSQKMDLAIKLLSHPDQYNQFHFVHGKVTKSKDCSTSEECTTTSYLKLRYQQMKEAAIMKYGDSVQGEGWDHTLKSLTIACVKFELLSNTARNTVKLKLESSEERSVENSLQGSFVMYNCARLATLLAHFEDAVKKVVFLERCQKVSACRNELFEILNIITMLVTEEETKMLNFGTYPPLPPIDTVDFCTLREEEEWGLLFNYVHAYPDIVRETIKEIESDKSMFVSLHTHKICQMLIGLSRAVSSYYSRYHVLGESRSHLLPTMYARLHLLKTVHQIIVNSLRLLGITPLTQL